MEAIAGSGAFAPNVIVDSPVSRWQLNVPARTGIRKLPPCAGADVVVICGRYRNTGTFG